MYRTDQTPTDMNDSRAGFALAATISVFSLLSVLVVTVFANAMSSFRSGLTDLGKTRTFYAAEAGAESAMAQLAVALEDAVLDDTELNAISAPSMTGFSFDSFTVERIGGITTEQITDGPFAGLFSLTQVVEITSEAVAPDYTSSAVMVTAKAQAIPIFQFGVFFEKDLEITNGPRMDFDGWVHSNGSIYLNSNNQYFGDVITTPNYLYHDRKDKHNTLTGTYIADAGANYVQLNFDSRDTPDYNAFRTTSDDRFDNRVKTNAYGVDSLRVPLPDGMDPVVVIQPRDNGDGSLERNAKFAWKADWYIEVDLGDIVAGGGGVNPPGNGNGNSACNASVSWACILADLQEIIDDDIEDDDAIEKLEDAVLKILDALSKMPDGSAAVSDLAGAQGDIDSAESEGLNNGLVNQLRSAIDVLIADVNAGGDGMDGSSLCGDGITHTRSGTLKSPNTSQCAGIFFFNSEKFYEGRELRYIDVIDIDVAALQAWGNSGSGDPATTLYITVDTVGAEDATNDGVYPVIRLINAANLVDPLTVSTNHPLYVQGNFNTGTWQPAGLIGDAITFLSTVWDDAGHQAATVIKPDAANTTVYAAVMAGHSGTPCDHEASGCGATSPYGGGLENFPRFLERWSGKSLTFRGSLVSLSFAQQATGLWNGAYYSPPIRDWEFDMRFNDPANMPPGTPVVGNVIHTAFRPIR